MKIKAENPIARYHVTGIEDLSGKKKERSDYNDKEEVPKDYKLKLENKNVWPFNENKDIIYEQWNKFPVQTHPDLIHQKIKYIHKSFHEIHPELLHLVHDIHGIFGRKEFISTAPELESPLVLFGQLIKFGDSLIPSIRIRIPFVEYLVNQFHRKTKPKVVYVKQPPKVQYIGVPYEREEVDPNYTLDTEAVLKYPETQRQLTKNLPNIPSVQYVTQGYEAPKQSIPDNSYGKINSGPVYHPEFNQPSYLRSRPDYDSRPPQPKHLYTSLFEKEVQTYKDRKKAAKA